MAKNANSDFVVEDVRPGEVNTVPVATVILSPAKDNALFEGNPLGKILLLNLTPKQAAAFKPKAKVSVSIDS